MGEMKKKPKAPIPPYRGGSNQACRECGKGPNALRHPLGHKYVPPRKKIGG